MEIGPENKGKGSKKQSSLLIHPGFSKTYIIIARVFV